MSQALYRFGPFTVDAGAHVLSKGDTRLSIQEQPFQVLLALLESAGQVVTREALRRRLWGSDTFVDFDQSLNSAVRRLRLALEDNSREPVFVETVPRMGFRFLPPVAVERRAAPDGAREQTVQTPAPRPHLMPAMLSEAVAERTSRRFPAALAGAGVLAFLLGLLLGVMGAHVRPGGAATVNAGRADAAAETGAATPGGGRFARITETGSSPWLRGGTVEMSALQGWYHLRQRTDGDYAAAQNAFEQVLARHPDDASALVGMGQADILMALNGHASREHLEQARARGQQALAKAPHLAMAHTLMGAADALLDWNDAEAEQEFRTALHLDPNDSLSHLWLAVFVLLPRRDYPAAEKEALTAVAEDPLSLIAHTDLGWIFYSEGKRQAALEQYRFVLQLNPNFVPGEFRMRQMLSAEGRLGDEQKEIPAMATLQGRVDDAAATKAVGFEATGVCAQASAWLSVPNEARLPVLQAAVAKRCPTVYFFGQDPELAKLQKEPAFVALLQSSHRANGLR